MRIIDRIEKDFPKLVRPVLTIGNFDGVHRGHQALFERVKEWAKEIEGQSVVMTFHPHPMVVLSPENRPQFITPYERKLQLIEDSGVDVTIVAPFDRDFARVSAPHFIEEFLVERIRVRAIVVGHDYRFGRNREGDTRLLKEMGKRFGFEVETVAGIEIDGILVSSTAIRKLIKDGDLQRANKLLGRPYEIRGKVIKGRDRGGRILGFPTANIQLGDQISPKFGVYVVEVDVNGTTYGGAANLGVNPTFGDNRVSLEVYILNFNRNIYGKTIVVRFLSRIRDETAFSSPKALKEQIQRDVEMVKSFFKCKGACLLAGS